MIFVYTQISVMANDSCCQGRCTLQAPAPLSGPHSPLARSRSRTSTPWKRGGWEGVVRLPPLLHGYRDCGGNWCARKTSVGLWVCDLKAVRGWFLDAWVSKNGGSPAPTQGDKRTSAPATQRRTEVQSQTRAGTATRRGGWLRPRCFQPPGANHAAGCCACKDTGH